MKQRLLDHNHADLAALIGVTVIVDRQTLGKGSGRLQVLQPLAGGAVVALDLVGDPQFLVTQGHIRLAVALGKGAAVDIGFRLQRNRGHGLGTVAAECNAAPTGARHIDRAARERMDTMLPRMIEAAGITEELKARDPMRWVGLMNTLKAQAEEVILTELIYQ